MNFQIFSTGVKASKNESQLSVIVNSIFFVWVSVANKTKNKQYLGHGKL